MTTRKKENENSIQPQDDRDENILSCFHFSLFYFYTHLTLFIIIIVKWSGHNALRTHARIINTHKSIVRIVSHMYVKNIWFCKKIFDLLLTSSFLLYDLIASCVFTLMMSLFLYIFFVWFFILSHLLLTFFTFHLWMKKTENKFFKI